MRILNTSTEVRAKLFDEIYKDILDISKYAEGEREKAMVERFERPESMTSKSVWDKRIDRMTTEKLLCMHLIDEIETNYKSIVSQDLNQ